jgi:hypothetical protein
MSRLTGRLRLYLQEFRSDPFLSIANQGRKDIARPLLRMRS